MAGRKGRRGSWFGISAKRNLKDKKVNNCLQCDKTVGTRAKVYFFRLPLAGYSALSLQHGPITTPEHEIREIRNPVRNSITVDLGVDDLVEDGGDGFFGGPEPRQIQTGKKSVALSLSGKEEPKDGGVSFWI